MARMVTIKTVQRIIRSLPVFLPALCFGVVATSAMPAMADWMPPANLSEFQPPTPEDWQRLAMLRQARCAGPVCNPQPIVVYGEVIYFPEAPCPRCGQKPHMSFQGQYGMRHPMPYYIPEPPKVIFVPNGVPNGNGMMTNPHCPHCQAKAAKPQSEQITETETVVLNPTPKTPAAEEIAQAEPASAVEGGKVEESTP